MTFRTFIRPLFVALSLAFATSAAAPAFADGADAKPAPAKDAKAIHAKKLRLGNAEKFPMTADKFTKVVDKRIERVKAKVEGAMKKHKVADADKAKVLKEFDDGAALVRAAAKKAGTDGQVTAAEAKEVQALAKKLHEQMRTKLGKDKKIPAKEV